MRHHAPATQRNREPILAVLQNCLPSTGTVLEISSGSGEHAIFFAPQLLPRLWLPTDVSPTALDSIAAWREAEPAENLLPPIPLDVHEPTWPVEQDPLPPELASLDREQHPITAIVNINMIHIAPWSACLGLMAGAHRLLPPGGILYLYGPFKRDGQHTAPSNLTFDTSLRAQNPAWGVRDLEEVITVAASTGLHLVQTVAMPANNLSVIFQAS